MKNLKLKRSLAFLLDLILFFYLSTFVFVKVWSFIKDYAINESLKYVSFFVVFTIAMLFREYWTIGKRIFRLKTVDSRKGTSPKFSVMILRGYLGIMLFPIEAATLWSTDQRLFDRYFYTNVINNGDSKKREK